MGVFLVENTAFLAFANTGACEHKRSQTPARSRTLLRSGTQPTAFTNNPPTSPCLFLALPSPPGLPSGSSQPAWLFLHFFTRRGAHSTVHSLCCVHEHSLNSVHEHSCVCEHWKAAFADAAFMNTTFADTESENTAFLMLRRSENTAFLAT